MEVNFYYLPCQRGRESEKLKKGGGSMVQVFLKERVNFYNLRFIIFTFYIYIFGPASVGSYKIGVVGNNWLVGWLVTEFSQKRL